MLFCLHTVEYMATLPSANDSELVPCSRGNRLTTYFDVADVLVEEVQVQDDNPNKHATSSSEGRLVGVF